MSFQGDLRRWAQRFLLSFGSAFMVSLTAFVGAWLEYREKDHDQPLTFWQFATAADVAGVQQTCLLAGIFTFPLCLGYSTGWDGTRSSLVKVLFAIAVTALFAILAAIVMAGLHLSLDHH